MFKKRNKKKKLVNCIYKSGQSSWANITKFCIIVDTVQLSSWW